MQPEEDHGYSPSAKIFCCLCVFFIPIIVLASIFLAHGIDTLHEAQSAQIGLNQDECIIKEFHSYNCDCYHCDNSGYQYMYHAIANKSCGNQTILSEKDQCLPLDDKEIPLQIGDTETCFFYQCDEYFTFDSPSELSRTAYMYYGFGVGLLIFALLCCLCCICAIATSRITI